MRKKVCHRLNSFQKKSKTTEKWKKRNEEKKHCANELNYTNFSLDCSLNETFWNVKYHIFTISLSLHISPVEFSLFFLSLVHVTVWSLSFMCVMLVWSFELFYYEWAGLTSKTFFLQNLLSTEYFSTLLFLGANHTHAYDNCIFSIDNENIYRLH